MTHLTITQGSTAETVSTALVKKLYDIAISIPEPLQGETDNAQISGHISVGTSYRNYVTYLAGTIMYKGIGEQGNNPHGRFLNLLIDVTNTYYIDFMDDAFSTACANLYGNGEGVTLADIAGVTSLKDSTKNLVNYVLNNSNIITLDFRSFRRLNFAGIHEWNLPSLQNIYVDSVSDITITAFRYAGPTTNGKSYLDRVIINTFQYTDTKYTSVNILIGSTDNSNTFGTIAIRNFDLHDGVTKLTIGNYTTRNNCSITNLYLGNSPFPVSYSEGYGDNLARISNIYVPVGMAQAYIDNGTWVHNGVARTDFIEYDFDTDPDGIFSVFDE